MLDIYRFLIFAVKKLRFLSAVSMHLVKLTGKSPYVVHPKHLVNTPPWFLKYLKKKDTVLDLGSGNGENSFLAASKVKNLVGLDKILPERKIKNATFLVADLEERLAFSDQSFSVVLCLDVLEHLYKRDQLLSEVKRILKPKGLLLLSLPNSQTSWKKLQRKYKINSFTDPDHKVEYSLKQIRALCLKAGWRIASVEVVTLDTPLASLIDLVGGLSLPLYAWLSKRKRERVMINPKETSGYRILCQKYD